MVALALTRHDLAQYLAALIDVYTVIVFAYVVTNMVFSFGVRVPYARWSTAILGFLRDVTEPYLRIFRRVLPMMGPLDLSPLVGIIVLQVVGNIVVSLVNG